MKKITVTTSSFSKCDKKALELLSRSGFKIILNPYARKLKHQEILSLCKDSVGIIAGTETLDAQTLEKLVQLRVISRCGSSLDNIDLAAAKRLQIKVFYTPDAPTLAVAELSVGLILALLRKIAFMDREMRLNLWNKRMGSLLCGKDVGIVGFGKIGRKVAELLKALGAKVYYCDPLVKKETTTFTKVEFKELLKKSDLISLHLPYSKENRNLLGKDEFLLMKQGSFLINCSRGGILDEAALYVALKENRLAGCALDVFEQEPYDGPLKKLDNVILTPHIGSYAKEARTQMEIEATENLIKGLKSRAKQEVRK